MSEERRCGECGEWVTEVAPGYYKHTTGETGRSHDLDDDHRAWVDFEAAEPEGEEEEESG